MRHNPYALRFPEYRRHPSGESVADIFRREATVARITDLAADGDAEAQRLLNLLERSGIRPGPEETVCGAWFWDAALAGDADAQCFLGASCLPKPGLQCRDWRSAALWLRKSADQGNPAARYLLADTTWPNDWRKPPSKADAQGMLQAARDGDVAAMVRIAECLSLLPLPLSGAEVKEIGTWESRAAALDYLPVLRERLPKLQNDGTFTVRFPPGNQAETEPSVRLYRRCAELGDPVAQRVYGKICARGIGMPPSAGEAYAWFFRAACQGDTEAMRLTADGLMTGNGVAQDTRAALEFYRRAAEAGDGPSALALADACRDGRMPADSGKDEVYYLKKAAAEWIPEADYRLGYHFLRGNGVKPNSARANTCFGHVLEYVSTYAQRTDPSVCRMVADICLNGYGVPASPLAALGYLRCAARQGDAEAQAMLPGVTAQAAKELPDGFGTPEAQDFRETAWMVRLAEACLKMSVPDACERAFMWFRIAADSGDIFGQFRAGQLQMNGIGVKRSLRNGVVRIRKAADADCCPAQKELAHCYEKGLGVTRSPERAAHWIMQAALHDDTEALFTLARYYLRGFGVPEDVSIAEETAERAEALGGKIPAALRRAIGRANVRETSARIAQRLAEEAKTED